MSFRLQLLATSLIAFGTTHGVCQATTDNAWATGFGFPPAGDGLNNRSRAVLEYGSALVATGDFVTAGTASVSRIAQWQPGTGWTALGTGLGGGVVNGRALCLFGTDLIVGGVFSTAGGTAAANVARWTGSTWQALGPGVGGSVDALTAHGGQLFAGGGFVASGDGVVTLNHIAQWNGVAWTALSSGVTPTTSPAVRALASYDTLLVAAGQFSSAGGTSASNIAAWTGLAWIPLGDGFNAGVRALAVIGDSLFAGGAFTMSGSTAVDHIAVWDGSSWQPVGGGVTGGDVTALAAFSTSGESHLAVVGSFTQAAQTAGQFSGQAIAVASAARWSTAGGRGIWSRFGSGIGNTPNAATPFGTGLAFGGDFSHVAGTSIPSSNVAVWDDSETVSTPLPHPAASPDLLVQIDRIRPNPAHSNTTVYLNVGRTVPVKIELFSVDGRRRSTFRGTPWLGGSRHPGCRW